MRMCSSVTGFSGHAFRERRLVMNYGNLDVRTRSFPPEGEGAGKEGQQINKRVEETRKRTESIQQHVDHFQEVQKKTYSAIQANRRQSDEVAKTTYQYNTVYRLEGGTGPRGEGMSEGYRRAQTLQPTGPQLAMNDFSPAGDNMNYADLLERGYSMGPGPRRAPPRVGYQQMPMGPSGPMQMPFPNGQMMPYGPNMNPMMQPGNRFNTGYQPNMVSTGNVDVMSDQQVTASMNNFIMRHASNIVPANALPLISEMLPPEVQRAIVRLIQGVEGPDGRALAGAVNRLVPASVTASPGNLIAFMVRANSLMEAIAQNPQVLQQYLRSRAPADLEALVGSAPAGDQMFMRTALSSLSNNEADALGRVMAHLDTVMLLLRTMPEPPEAVQKQLMALLEGSSQGQVKRQFNTLQPNSFNAAPQAPAKLDAELSQRTESFAKRLQTADPALAKQFIALSPDGRRLVTTLLPDGTVFPMIQALRLLITELSAPGKSSLSYQAFSRLSAPDKNQILEMMRSMSRVAFPGQIAIMANVASGNYPVALGLYRNGP